MNSVIVVGLLVIVRGLGVGSVIDRRWRRAAHTVGRAGSPGCVGFSHHYPAGTASVNWLGKTCSRTRKRLSRSSARGTHGGVDRPPREGDTGFYNQFWLDPGTAVVPTKRTSLIVDPPDGRMPTLTAEAFNAGQPGAQPAGNARSGSVSPGTFQTGSPTGPRIWGWPSGVQLRFNSGPPMLPSVYNNIKQLFQTPGYVVILNEMVHDARIIPLDGLAHLPEDLRQWMGDARGHWDGDTLVVDSTAFTIKTSSFSPAITSGVDHRRDLAPHGAVQPGRRADALVRIHGR